MEKEKIRDKMYRERRRRKCEIIYEGRRDKVQGERKQT